MNPFRIALIREGKTPPDKRVPLSPEQCVRLAQQHPHVSWQVQSSDIRTFPDAAYQAAGLHVTDDISEADVILGVKEVPLDMLQPDKTYFFFSHTIKEQPYNRDLLREILKKRIRLIDWEVLTDSNRNRLIGFGKYAGIVGAYNGLRAYGQRFGTYDLLPAHECEDRAAMYREFEKLDLPPVKVLLTGRGRVAEGAMETLRAAGIRQVEVAEFLEQSFDESVFTQAGVEHYNRRTDGGEGERFHFYKHPELYESDFMKLARVADLFVAGHFYAEGSPFLFTREDARDPEFRIRVVADISCDIDGPVASTIRPSTIEDPIYGYNPHTEQEDDFRKDEVITVMAVDNLPCELPKDASEGFGEDFITYVWPHLIKNDREGVLARATITQHGKLTPKFEYLKGYVAGE